MLRFYFIRHAESEANANNHIICGRSDHVPLSERGLLQAQLLARRLHQEDMHFDQWFSSVSLRARQTAEAVARQFQHPLEQIQFSDQLVEIGKGEWEGKVRQEIYTPEMRRMILNDSYEFRPPGGESQKDVEERMWKWINGLAQSQNGRDLDIAIFSHGFAIKSLLVRLLGTPPQSVYQIITHNSSINGIKYDGERWYVERVNDHSHLSNTEFIGHYW
jgi:broad specificity phosphatase PhoE